MFGRFRKRLRAAAKIIMLWDRAEELRVEVRSQTQKINYTKVAYDYKLNEEESLIVQVDKFLINFGKSVDELK